MSELARTLDVNDQDLRRQHIIDTLVDAFSELMKAAPAAFRTKFRKMAASPFAFYRGSACTFYADVARLQDPWADERTSRVWIQGDLHAENFGTYMNGEGVLVFDVNDFDEAYVGHFTWDLQRFATSIALLGWSKALPDEEIERFVRHAGRAYLDQVRQFVHGDRDAAFSLRLDTTEGLVHHVLQQARLQSRGDMLSTMTETEGYDRRFREGPGVRRLDRAERERVMAAFEQYLDTIPQDKKMRDVAYTVKDLVGRSGFGIGSAGLPAYNFLIEGENEALENDLVLSMKQGNVAAPSRVVADRDIREYFRHHGQRTAVSQRALQAHADPLLGYTELDGVGYVVDELSPYESDLDWEELTEPDEILPVLDYLGRAVAKVHCVSDTDSDHTLVPFQTEEAIAAVVDGREEEFMQWLWDFARDYADVVRDDHRLFVDAFRHGEIPGVSSTKAE
ncbi:uncharacterized protein (DUF2252 family) [Halopolyspora algeriensis]|uniref:Uncharacterized protein (DUF2252 family) n=1 Tax=Halopolyspora algeriensis TaxID=1500506 RepID=A0A368VFW1_9ACTN|nr:DUF2252 domain-containing protein [Halopolyspora algeriensis]RCW40052.1 uncharacterized protein (DUF2252 family) [Halopolyspora algeriensis]TQM56799.1 uncharacterized protein (DUF2252 family) [Halopolyspora algeriensis]